MKNKLLIILAVLAAAGILLGATSWTSRQHKAHQIADLARELGVSEDNAIIREASLLWWAENEDVRILANVLAHECPYCSDRQQQLTAQVVINRVRDARFPDTVRGVVEQSNIINGILVHQYAPSYTQNLPDYATGSAEVKRCFANAVAVMNGDVDCPSDVIYQANFPQGAGTYETIQVDTGAYRSTTYFCYG